jgi:hypothetical protein
VKRTIKLRAKAPDAPERKVRLRLPGHLAAELDEYRDLYVQADGHEIDLASVIAGILEQFLGSDRFFQRRRRDDATTATPPDPKPPARGP